MSSPFPTSNDSDSTLYVANDNVQTKLSVAQQTTDTVAIVVSTAKWTPNMIATIENEQELVTAVVGANTLQVTRNFNGAGTALHPAGSFVSNFVDAAYQKALSSAIQTTQAAFTGSVAWPGAVKLKSADGVFVENFNDTVQGVGSYREFGTPAKPMSNLQSGEYGKYYQDIGPDGANTYKAVAIESHLYKGMGNTFAAMSATAIADGTWQPGTGIGGPLVTTGVVAGNFSAQTTRGGSALGLLVTANTTNVAGSSTAAIEINTYNNVAGTAGKSGIGIFDFSPVQATTPDTNYGIAISAIGGAVGYHYGLLIVGSPVFGVEPSGTLIRAQGGTVATGLNFTGMTFTGPAISTPGFTLDASGGITCGSFNFIGTETGANNAIAASASAGMNVGVQFAILLAHTLQAGANTFNYNAGGPKNIRSSRNPANNIGTAYAVGGIIRLLWDGTQWLDLSQ